MSTPTRKLPAALRPPTLQHPHHHPRREKRQSHHALLHPWRPAALGRRHPAHAQLPDPVQHQLRPVRMTSAADLAAHGALLASGFRDVVRPGGSNLRVLELPARVRERHAPHRQPRLRRGDRGRARAGPGRGRGAARGEGRLGRAEGDDACVAEPERRGVGEGRVCGAGCGEGACRGEGVGGAVGGGTVGGGGGGEEVGSA